MCAAAAGAGLHNRLRRGSSQFALLTPDGVTPAPAIWEVVDAAGAVLQRSGVRLGDVVAVRVTPSLTYLSTLLAVWAAGCVPAVVDHRAGDGELRRACAALGPRCVVGTAAAPPGAITRFRTSVPTTVKAWDRPRDAGVEPPPADVALVQLSSGSTGTPKIIARPGPALLAELDRFRAVPGWVGGGERLLLLNSMTHSLGLVGGLLHAMDVGAEICVASSSFPRDVADAAARHRPDLLSGVPAQFALLARLARGSLGTDLRATVSGGETMPKHVRSAFAARHGIAVGQSYGSTETGVLAMDVSGPEPPAVGPVLPGVELTTDDGGVQVRMDRTPYLAGGGNRYRDGRLHLDDRGELGHDGVLTVRGRSDSLVSVGGLKVDLAEVEDVLRTAEFLSEAVVVWQDQSMHAYVEATGGVVMAQIVAHCGRYLAAYKIPREHHVLAALPRTPNGKLVRDTETLKAAARRAGGS